jgi:serpin B
MMRMSATLPTPPVPFIADHPFLFLIREQASHSVLFLGRLSEPKS